MHTMKSALLWPKNPPQPGSDISPSALGAGAPNSSAGVFSLGNGWNANAGRVGSTLGGVIGSFGGPIGSAIGSGVGGYAGGWGRGKSIGSGVGSLIGSAFGPIGTIVGGYLGGQIGGGAMAPETNTLGQEAQFGWGNESIDQFGNPTGSLSNIASEMNMGNQGYDAADVGGYGGDGDFEGGGYEGFGGFARGGMVYPGMLSGPNPAGPDDGYGALELGEGVLTADAMGDIGEAGLAALNKSAKKRKMVKALLGDKRI